MRYWESPETTAVNRLSPRPVSGDRVLALDGSWKFQLTQSPDAEPGIDWRRVSVPSLWTMGDFGDSPQYTNVQLPFDEQAPFVPAHNPTGIYERTFEVPLEWAGQRIALRVGGFEGVLRVELNGELVGLAKDGRIASDFDLTHALDPDANVVRLVISKWSDATFIEDQDQWWHAGISRSVELYASPKTHVAQLHVTPTLDSTVGLLRVRSSLAYAAGMVEAGHSLRVRLPELNIDASIALSTGIPQPLESPRERDIAHAWFTSEYALGGAPESLDAVLAKLEPKAAGNCDITLRLLGVEAWSAERPQLYSVIVEHIDAHGLTTETFHYRLGFRSVAVVGRELLVNGEPVMLYGVNRHDFHPRTGRVLSREDIRADLLELKRWNVNAIRTAHYPNDPELLRAADELGFYIVAEANIESHANMHTIADDPRYLGAFVDRVSRLVQRDIHHASVILWSLGNESGNGANHEAAASWVRRFDPTRPLHYEGAIRGNWDAGQHLTDVVCPMYPSVAAIVRFAESGEQTRPLIMCEYSHAMGNSNGSLADYWEAIERHEGLQGGFIWEMWDHGLTQTLADGRERAAYGGDFGELRHDGNFCCDGVFFPDRQAKPAMHEFKQLASPLVIQGLEPADGRFTIHNRQFFSDGSAFVLQWQITEDGVVTQAGDLEVPGVPPRGAAALALEAAAGRPVGDGERFITFSVRRRDATQWALAMTEVGWAQFPLPARRLTLAPSVRRTPATVQENGEITVGRLTIQPRLSLWRAPTDNDRIGGVAELWERWGIRALTREIHEVAQMGADGTSVRSTWHTGSGLRIDHHQFVSMCEGGIRVREHAFIPTELHDLARVGTMFHLPLADTVEWFGTGPHETYADRTLARIGRWVSPGIQTHVDYIRPQANGARTGVRWADVHCGPESWRVTNDAPMQTSFTPYDDEELAQATHHDDLGRAERTVLHIDVAHRGLGTASCGPDILDLYRVPTGAHAWTWSLQRLK